MTIKQLLLGVQELLGNPNVDSPAQHEALALYKNKREEYNRIVREFSLKNQ